MIARSQKVDRAKPVSKNGRFPAAAGILFGLGLGGFLDGIVLHQVLQWHHMVSSWRSPDSVPGLRMNTLADGLFHVVAWLFVLAGIGTLYSRVTRNHRQAWSSGVLWGWALVGW